MDRSDLIRLPEVMRMTGLSKTEIYRRMNENRFPKNRKLSPRVAAWRRGDVVDWCITPHIDNDARGLI